MLIAQAGFLLERGQTDRRTNKQTDTTDRLTDTGGYTADVGNKQKQASKASVYEE